MHRRIAAAHANGEQLRDFFGNGEQTGHRLEGPAHEVRVESRDDDALAEVGEFGAGLDD